MAADSLPAGGGIDDVFPAWWKNIIRAHPVLSPRRRRRRRGNQGQAGGSASSAVERVDGASTPTGGAPGINPALETKTSVVSPQRADSGQTDDVSALAKGLLDVTLVPETTVQSVPDVPHRRPSTKRYRPIPIPRLSDSASTRLAASLWRVLS
jgi:hypothetical protein